MVRGVRYRPVGPGSARLPWHTVLGEAVTLAIEGGPAQVWSALQAAPSGGLRVEELQLPLEADGPQWFWVEGQSAR